MLNTYIKNIGATQSFIHNNNKNKFSEMNWDSDYDGNVANILVNSNNNGKRHQYNISLDNNDLANLLNVPSVSTPIDKRLKMDFKRPQMIEHNPQALMVHLPYSDEMSSYDNSYPVAEPFSPLESLTNSPKSYLSSPMLNDEFIVPVTIGKKTTNLGSKKKNKTYQIFKKKKPSSKRRSRRSSSKRRSRSKSSYKTKTRSSRR